MSRHFPIILTLMLIPALQACSSRSLATPVPPQPRLTASIQDIMKSIVDPAADTLWESVETTVTKDGTVVKEPRTEPEWQFVRNQAIQLAEAANLLTQSGRQVVHEGRTLEDSHVAGILPAAEIEAGIKADPAVFDARARALQASAEVALAAIDARDAKRLVEAGGQIDGACEQCHLAYWYPNDRRPTTVPSLQ